MISIDTLRQFRIDEYAIFDLAAAFIGIYLLSPFLTKLFLKLRIKVPKQNWIYLTLPISIGIHLIIGSNTAMVQNFFDLQGHYILKLIIICLFALGTRGIKFMKK